MIKSNLTNIKDGKSNGLRINKTNWANKVDKAPFYAYGVACGITFTYGGLKVSKKCEVLNKKYQSRTVRYG